MNFIMVFGFSLLYRQKLHELHKFMWNLRIMFFSMIWDDSNLTACTKKSHDQSHKCAYFISDLEIVQNLKHFLLN